MKKRYILMAVTAALVFAVAAGGTMAANRVVTEDVADIATPLASYKLEIGLTTDGSSTDVAASPGTPLEAAKNDFAPFTVSNEGNLPAYVRVTITKYWETRDDKVLPADNVLIDYGAAGEEWFQGSASLFDDPAETNPDTVVFYHKAPLSGAGASPLLRTITIDGESTGNAYADATLHVEAVAESVQFSGADHNDVNQSAILAAWGVNATLNGDGSIASVDWPE